MMNKYFSTLARMISFIDFIYYKAYSAIDFSQEILMEVFVLCNSSSFSKEKMFLQFCSNQMWIFS